MFAKFSGTGLKCFRGLEEREIDDGLMDLVRDRLVPQGPRVLGEEARMTMG